MKQNSSYVENLLATTNTQRSDQLENAKIKIFIKISIGDVGFEKATNMSFDILLPATTIKHDDHISLEITNELNRLVSLFYSQPSTIISSKQSDTR